jgi:hypothetical protein
MPRMTQKYKKACEIAAKEGISSVRNCELRAAKAGLNKC